MNPETKTSEKDVLKEVWQFMLSKEIISQKELIEVLSKKFTVSASQIYLLLQLISKPIQTELKIVNGRPQAEFYEPLILQMPSLDSQVFWTLTHEWRDNVTQNSNIFNRAKRFYSLRSK